MTRRGPLKVAYATDDGIDLFCFGMKQTCRTKQPCGLSRGSAAARCWDCGFESRRGHGCLSLVSVVRCQVEVSASGRSLVQRSPTESDVSGSVMCLSVTVKPR